MALTDKLTAIADAIRGKTGKTEPLTLDQMAAEIAGIQTGGGAVVPGVTFVDCITIRQDGEYGYKNGIGMPFACKDVGKIDVRAKFPSSGNWIWLCGYKEGSLYTAPYANGLPTTDVITNEVDENGVTHLVWRMSLANADNLKIGSWGDVNFSQTITFYEINLYNKYEEPLAYLRPAVNEYGTAVFVDTISGTIYKNIAETASFVADLTAEQALSIILGGDTE